MLTFTELVKKAKEEARLSTLVNINEEQKTYISVGDKILEIVNKQTSVKKLRTSKGWIKSVAREIKNKKNIHPKNYSKINKYINSKNCTPAEYLLLGGDATKQLFQLMDKGLDFMSAAKTKFNESE